MNKYNKYGDALKELTGAYKDGLRNMQSMAGQSGDRDVRLYELLKQDDFAALSEQVGIGTVLKYIEAMELRRLKERQNGR